MGIPNKDLLSYITLMFDSKIRNFNQSVDIHWINDPVSFSIPVRDVIKWGQKEEIWVFW